MSSLESGIEAFSKRRFEEAIFYLKQAVSDGESTEKAYRLLGNCLRTVGRVDEAITAYRAGLERGYQMATHQRLLNALNYFPFPQEDVAQEHFAWGQRAVAFQRKKILPHLPHPYNANEDRKIHVGFVSADFKSHPVASFLFPIFKNYDKNHFHYTCYSNESFSDSVTDRCKQLVDNWRIVKGLPTAAAIEMIHRDEVDILVDLSGHTSGNRLDIFSNRVAPLQITYLGYPNTTGLSTIDYRLVDVATDPLSIPETWHSEKLYRLPGSFLCHEPLQEEVPVTSPPHLKNGYITFGSFNKTAKISDQCLELWVNILLRVPESRLLLKSITFESHAEEQRLRNRCMEFGLMDGQRLVCRKPVRYRKDHLALYNEMDIALDTFPYNGTTTTVQALLMSTPVITLRGASHVARVSSSLLRTAALEELVADSPAEYEEVASELAADRGRLAHYKKTLRERVLCSALVDGPKFVKMLENAFLEMLVSVTSTDKTKTERLMGPIV